MTETPFTLITGASGGIGKELARVFAGKGHNLLLVARREAELQKLSEELEKQFACRALYQSVDLANAQDREKFFNWVDKSKISVDILVNNAGFGDFGEFSETDWEKMASMIEVNITALTQLTHFFVQGMKKHRCGKILNVASVAGFLPGPLMAVYYATKAYVLSFSQAIAVELADYNIGVTALCPGPTSSDFSTNAQAKDSKLFKRENMASPMAVAEYGYQALMNGRIVAVHRWSNRLILFSLRFLPRFVVRRVVLRAQRVR